MKAELHPVAAGTNPGLILLDPGNFTPLYDLNLGKALAARGWDVCWVTSTHAFDDMPASECLSVAEDFFRSLQRPLLRHVGFARRFPRLRRIAKVLYYPRDLAAFSRKIEATEPGIVHVQWGLLPSLDVFFWRKWQRRGWIVVYTAHDPAPLWGSLPPWLTYRRAHLWETADAVIVHGRVPAEVVRQAGIDEERIHLLPPGPPVGGPAPSRADARRALGLDEHVPVVLFFGYIKKYKGLDVLLRSLVQLRNSIGKFVLIVAGECMESRSRYDRLISELGLEEEVVWHAGYVPNSLMGRYFGAADVVALPYLQASCSGVLLSACAYERPVVATAVGGTPELLEDGVSGLLVPPDNPPALAAALSAVLGDKEMASRMGMRGRQVIEQRFDWSEIARQTEALYRCLWDRRAGSMNRTRRAGS